MTDLLKDTMNEHADSAEAPVLDVLAMVREGNRRVARRRTAILGAGVAAVVAAAVAVPTLLPKDHQVAKEFSFASAFESSTPAYAVGGTVTIDGHSFDTGLDVLAMVQTTAGLVLVDHEGVVWSATGEATTRIGTTSTLRAQFALRADGSRAAWTEYADGQPPAFTSFDQATGQTVQTTYQVRGGASEYSDALYAVDGDDVFFRDDRGVIRWDAATGVETELGVVLALELDGVQDGKIAYALGNADGGSVYRVGSDFTSGAELDSPWVSGVALAPDAKHLLGSDGTTDGLVFDVASGGSTPAPTAGYDEISPYGWVDADTYVALGFDRPWETSPADLLTCQVDGACSALAEDIGSVADGLVVAIGEPMDN